MYFKEKILKVVKLLQEDFKQNIKEFDMENAKESRSHILSLLYERGYEIKLEKRSPTGGYDAHFDHKIAVNPSCKYSYSSEWTEQEIKHDLVYKLLSWSGLKIKTVLDY